MWTKSTPTARASCLLSIRAWLQQVAAQTSVIVKQDCGFAFLDCVTGAAEVAVNRTLIQRRATGDSRGQTLQTSSLTRSSCFLPLRSRLLATLSTQRRKECTWMNHSHQRGYVAEAKGGHQTSLWRGRAQVELLTQPGQVRVMAKHRIHTVQRTVRRQHSVAQHLGQANQLECGSTALGVTGQGLLRNDKQRVTSIAAHRRCDALMQVRLIRVIGIGRGVVLGNHSDFVHAHTKLIQALCQTRIRTTTGSRQRAQTRSRNGGVRTVSEGLRKAHNTKNRQSQLSSKATARHQDGAAAFRLNEATTTAVIRTREVLVVNA